METAETIWRYLSFSIYDLSPQDVWGVFALVTLLYVGFLFLYFLRFALASVPQDARGIVIAAAAFIGFIMLGVISQGWYRGLIVGMLAVTGACVGLMVLLLPAFTLGQQFAGGEMGSLTVVLSYVIALLYLFAYRSLAVTVLYLCVLAYQVYQAVPDIMSRLAASGSSAQELKVVFPGVAVLMLSGLLLSPAVITAYPAIEILVLVGAFMAGIRQYDRRWNYTPYDSRRTVRIIGYSLLGILALAAVVVYAKDFVQLPSQLRLVMTGQLGQLGNAPGDG